MNEREQDAQISDGLGRMQQDFHSLPQWRAEFDTAPDGLPAWVWMIVAAATVAALAGVGITAWGWIIKAVDAANVGVAPW